MAYGHFKHLNGRTAADKVLYDQTFSIAKNPKYDGCQHNIALMVYKIFDKKLLVEQVKMKSFLAEALHRSIIRKFKKRKVHSPFRDNIWGTDIADMQLISKFNK